ncbi:MAG: hypothetical protein RI907_2147 [Pseudomonadota bacterium]|jgi:YVTN family beta-propeller protein
MRTTFRLRHVSTVVGASLLACGGHAFAATLLQQSFSSGLGAFTSVGTVSTASGSAVMTGSTFGADGAITSKAINTQGFKNIVVEFDRSTKGMTLADGGIVEYSVNGGAYVRLESTRITATARAQFALPAAAENANVTIRFRANALFSSETYTVNNVLVSGTEGGAVNTGSAPVIGDYAHFETGHARPMALSPDGSKLYVVNSPDNRVEVFDVTGSTPVLKESIAVGMQPIAVAFAPNGQLWVVNHLSDSVSIVDVSAAPARVVNTLWTGDEPGDIVFAGQGNKYAFITAAHRGQNTPFNDSLSTPQTGRADVWVFDANNPGTQAGGKPVKVVNMFGDSPRALARSADGSKVYAAIFHSGNKTTVLMGGPSSPLDKATPLATTGGSKAPQSGLIVQKNANGDWVDGGDARNGVAPKTWNNNVKIDLPDYDVFTIDANAAEPSVTSKASGVGTTIYNMAVNPVNGKVYVSNTEARNVHRFEGPGTIAESVNGHFVESRITVVDTAGGVTPRHLNKHITSYGKGLGTAAEKAAAVSTPLEMAVTPDGKTLYLAAMGGNKIARYDTAQLENDSFTPSASQQLTVSGGLPTGVVLDTARGRAYVTTRQDNGLSVVNLSSFSESAHVTMYNPEPTQVVKGRKFLYDAQFSSSRGDSSCAGCHIFGDKDDLGWDLGNPDGKPEKNNNKYSPVVPFFLRTTINFHPMKGPMTTQTFQGMANHGPMHWRGDRQGVSPGTTVEQRAFKDFRVAFPGLLGRDGEPNEDELTAFADFALAIQPPPNPVRNLDNTLTPDQQAGSDFYFKSNADNIATCNGCHAIDPAKGQYGTNGLMTYEGPTISENFKIAPVRGVYTKVGFFGRNHPSYPNVGEQIRGFGYSLDGVQGSVNTFLDALVFVTVSAENRMKLEKFTLASPSNFDPIVGQQLTVTPTNGSQSDVAARLNLLVSRAEVTNPRPECELVAKGVVGGAARGWVYQRLSKSFISDRSGEQSVNLSSLLSLGRSNNSPITFTCAPPGNGTRMGISRKADGKLDGGV